MWDGPGRFADIEKFSLFTPFVLIPLETIFRATLEGIYNYHILIFTIRRKREKNQKREERGNHAIFGGRTPAE